LIIFARGNLEINIEHLLVSGEFILLVKLTDYLVMFKFKEWFEFMVLFEFVERLILVKDLELEEQLGLKEYFELKYKFESEECSESEFIKLIIVVLINSSPLNCPLTLQSSLIHVIN
jgi:hypothetical protein